MRIGKATFVHIPDGALTVYDDGSSYGALPHDTPEYRQLASAYGYPDILAYCRHHEFCHHLCSEVAFNRRSEVLWRLAHGQDVPAHRSAPEEALTMACQRWIMLGERPPIAGVDWEELRGYHYP